MKRMAGIKAASEATGLSEWELRRGTKSGDYPYIKIGEGRGKFLFDLDLLEQTLYKKAVSNMSGQKELTLYDNYGHVRKIAE